MAKRRLTQVEQDDIAWDLRPEGGVDPDEPEFERLYDQLDPEHQREVDAAFRRYADNAVGSEHWDTDR